MVVDVGIGMLKANSLWVASSCWELKLLEVCVDEKQSSKWLVKSPDVDQMGHINLKFRSTRGSRGKVKRLSLHVDGTFVQASLLPDSHSTLPLSTDSKTSVSPKFYLQLAT
jgi:hypothetical protein